MILKLFSIKDVLSGNFADVFIFPNNSMAIRYFGNVCKESKVKNDLQLFCLGTYNCSTGEICSNVEFLIGGADCE